MRKRRTTIKLLSFFAAYCAIFSTFNIPTVGKSYGPEIEAGSMEWLACVRNKLETKWRKQHLSVERRVNIDCKIMADGTISDEQIKDSSGDIQTDKKLVRIFSKMSVQKPVFAPNGENPPYMTIRIQIDPELGFKCLFL